jgi:hypothetical protein
MDRRARTTDAIDRVAVLVDDAIATVRLWTSPTRNRLGCVLSVPIRVPE